MKPRLHVLLLFALLLAAPAHAQDTAGYELSFDGVAPNADEIPNAMGLFGGEAPLALMTAGASRSTITEGRYGRALVLPGGSAALDLPVPLSQAMTYYFAAWVKLQDNNTGWLFEAEGSFGLRLEAGTLHGTFWQGATYQSLDTGLALPVDGAWHHVLASVQFSGSFPNLTADLATTVDFQTVSSVSGAVSFLPVHWWVGKGMTASLDDVWMRTGLPPNDVWVDLDPSNCGNGPFSCIETSFTTAPQKWPQLEPVRIKVIVPPQCTPLTPCPLLISTSGGGQCQDDYAVNATLVNAGFVFAAVDTHCQSTLDFKQYPQESSQIVAAKDWLVDPLNSPMLGNDQVFDLISNPSQYLAWGGSHGAGASVAVLLKEQDHALRAFAMSTAKFSPHCAYHNVMCEEQKVRVDTAWGLPHPHVDNSPEVAAIHAETQWLDLIDTATASSRELGLSWGENTAGPVCNGDGSAACFEESMGFRDGSLRARDRWRSVEPDPPTGYFFQGDPAIDCGHGTQALTSEQMGCIACFLKSGRAAMDLECPTCLATGLEDPSPAVCELAGPAPVPAFGPVAIAALGLLLAAAGLRRLHDR